MERHRSVLSNAGEHCKGKGTVERKGRAKEFKYFDRNGRDLNGD
jgi:hypothetical protein